MPCSVEAFRAEGHTRETVCGVLGQITNSFGARLKTEGINISCFFMAWGCFRN
jgi:hypothetical protein